jgi:hypothetical protein
LLAACGGQSERLLSEAEGGGGRGQESASVCGITGGRASAGFEIIFAEENERISHLAERDDGSLIGFRNRELVRIDRQGGVSTLALAPALAAALAGQESVSLSPHGRAALVAIDTSERFVFALDEPRLLWSFRAPDELHVLSSEFSASGELLVLTYGELGLYHSYPAAVEVRRVEDGSLVSTSLYLAKRDPQIPASDDRLVWPSGYGGGELLVTRLDQSELYAVQVPAQIAALRFSADASVLALHLYGNEVWHAVNGALAPPYLPDAGVADLELAPGGRWSAFSHATPGRVHLFESGEWRRGTPLPLELVNSLDVSDGGWVTVGGAAEDGTPSALLLDSELVVQFVCASESAAGSGAHVRFARDERRVIALFDDRLSVFSLE